MNTQTINDISFTRVKGRNIVHFLAFLTDEEKKEHVFDGYDIAIARAKKIGGQKFHNKLYGGGIAFDNNNLKEVAAQIEELVKAN